MGNLNSFALVAIIASLNKCHASIIQELQEKEKKETGHLFELAIDNTEKIVDESLISRQFHHFAQTVDDSTLICEGEVTLIRLNCPIDACDHDTEGQNGSCQGCKAYFCQVNFDEQKNHPEAVPTFLDLIGDSRHCDSVLIEKDFNEILNECKQYDENNKLIFPKALPVTGLITELGFTDSVLVTNAITSVSPNVRMLVDPQPIAEAMTICDNYKKNRQKKFMGKQDSPCNRDFASKLLEDVVYMLSRTRDKKEDRMIVKVSPAAVEGLDIFINAFPNVNWMYIYDDPVAAIMTQMSSSPIPTRANCVKTKVDPPPHIVAVLDEAGYDITTISLEEYCAAYLAMLSKNAVATHTHTKKGTFASSEKVLEMLPYVLTFEFGVDLDQRKYTTIVEGALKDRKGVYGLQLQATSRDQNVKKVTTSFSNASTKIYGPIFKEMEGLSFKST